MHRVVQSACEAVLSSYQSFCSDCNEENAPADDKNGGTKSCVTSGTASGAESDEAAPARDTSMESPWRNGVGDGGYVGGGETRRLEAALSALLREPYRRLGLDVGPKTEGGVVTAIRHCQQHETWDCGIACIQMILRWLRGGTFSPLTAERYGATAKLAHQERIERAWMLDAVDTESVWTIDLVILLEKILGRESREGLDFPGADADDWGDVSASYLFCSTKLGVDESYNDLGYYRNAFQRDEVRVTGRFKLARELGLPALCVSRLDMGAVIDLVSRPQCVAIVLLDNRVLLRPCTNSATDGNGMEPGALANHAESRRLIGNLEVGVEAEIKSGCINVVATDVNFAQEEGPRVPDILGEANPTMGLADKAPEQHQPSKCTESLSYAGHYVILCGVSMVPSDVARAECRGEGLGSSFCMVVKNPSSPSATDFITPAHFERAWRANGTDDDIIFVVKHEAGCH